MKGIGSSAPAARFPIGIYGVNDPGQLRTLHDAGFDCFQTYSKDPKFLSALASEARKLDMRLLIYPDEVQKGPSSAVADWPVQAWYLFDEPEGGRPPKPAKDLEEFSQRIRNWDSGRRQALTLGLGAASENYGSIGDILLLDWYPVPHRELDSVADQIDMAYRHMPKGKPLWMIIQAFDWRDYVHTTRTATRFPTQNEIRFMSYLSIVHGAKGLYFFQMRKPEGRTLLDFPEQWQVLARVVREIKAMQPVLEGAEEDYLPFTSNHGSLEGRGLRFGGRHYVILLNRGKQPAQCPMALIHENWRPLFEPVRDIRDLLLKEGDAWALGPHQVIVLENMGI